MRSSIRMDGSAHDRGLLDTNILILRRWVDMTELPNEMAISAVTLAELSAGLHQVRPNGEQDTYDEHAERARRLDVLQRAEHEFDPIPFGAEAARTYGRVTAAVVSAGRKPRRRIADLMIAATAIAESLPLFTTNPDDFDGLLGLLTVVPVTRLSYPATVDDRRRSVHSQRDSLRRCRIGAPGAADPPIVPVPGPSGDVEDACTNAGSDGRPVTITQP